MPTENKVEKTSIAVTITAIATLITALGGLIYALKSPNPSSDITKKNPTHLVDNTKNTIEKIYHGNVGKLETTFNLSFDKDSDDVNGTYYYNKKQDHLYELSGVSMKDDLHLNEFTKGILTANCVLKKANNGCFVGKMFNKDGRVFTMNLCE